MIIMYCDQTCSVTVQFTYSVIYESLTSLYVNNSLLYTYLPMYRVQYLMHLTVTSLGQISGQHSRQDFRAVGCRAGNVGVVTRSPAHSSVMKLSRIKNNFYLHETLQTARLYNSLQQPLNQGALALVLYEEENEQNAAYHVYTYNDKNINTLCTYWGSFTI